MDNKDLSYSIKHLRKCMADGAIEAGVKPIHLMAVSAWMLQEQPEDFVKALGRVDLARNLCCLGQLVVAQEIEKRSSDAADNPEMLSREEAIDVCTMGLSLIRLVDQVALMEAKNSKAGQELPEDLVGIQQHAHEVASRLESLLRKLNGAETKN
jgi:hypothetical protein